MKKMLRKGKSGGGFVKILGVPLRFASGRAFRSSLTL